MTTELEFALGRRLCQQRKRLDEINVVFELHPNVNVEFFNLEDTLQTIELTSKIVSCASRGVFDYHSQLSDIGDKEAADFIMKADIQ